MLLKSSADNIIVGYDLGNTYSQISYCTVEDKTVETLSMVAGAENFNIPTVLCKRSKVNQWFYGREALRYAEEGQGILVENLLEMAIDGEPILLEGESFDPVALLTLFLKRSLGMISMVASTDKISAMAITCEYLDSRMIEVLGRAVAGLNLKTKKIVFQSHTESFYYYMLHQPEELWKFQSLLCDYREDRIRVYRMECNRRTTPVVTFIEEKEYPILRKNPMPEADSLRRERMERLDREFLEIAEKVCENALISSVYLIGEDYEGDWMKESLRFLCKNRRVFQGSNLYSKGACYGMQERLESSEIGKSHVFLGNDKLKANVGMKILRRGEDSYYALLDAGNNWFEAEAELEFYLQEENWITLLVAPLMGKNVKNVKMTLDGWKGGISRMRLRAYLREENILVIEVEDLGFGELLPYSPRVWKEEIEIY